MKKRTKNVPTVTAADEPNPIADENSDLICIFGPSDISFLKFTNFNYKLKSYIIC